MRRLGKNINGYLGETVAIDEILRDCAEAAAKHSWTIEHLDARPDAGLVFLTRLCTASEQAREKRVYISAGIHGDEPAAPLALRNLLQQDQWPTDLSLYVCPCLNPTGFKANRRENAEGVDLNREFRHPRQPETIAHVDWLSRQPGFDLCLCLHEDWESHGFYVYELNPDDVPSLAPRMIQKVSAVCPIDYSELIEGRQAFGGIIRPSLDPRTRDLWPESFYLITEKTRLSYTLEAPSDFPITARVMALEAAVLGVVGEVQGWKHGR